jgi:hypothetical protein
MANDEILRALDATDTTQIIEALQTWINGLKDPITDEPVLPGRLDIEYVEDPNGLGFCIKADGGAVLEEDILGDITAEVPFAIYYTTNAVPDGAGAVYKPLNNLSAWFRKNGSAGLELGPRRTPDEIVTLKGPTDLSGKDEKGNTTFFSVYSLTYDEEAS